MDSGAKPQLWLRLRFGGPGERNTVLVSLTKTCQTASVKSGCARASQCLARLFTGRGRLHRDDHEVVIVGTGQHDNVRLSPEASEYLSKKGCVVLLQPTPEAIHSFNEMRKRKVGLMHVTC
ncbi:MTH938/NDUFAF3 family protein [Methylocystis sp. IM3]|uniref:MTH938/NDUFAF3 family protein n=1 Tax=Methylocystis sp. IM3 TaxID=3136722 RepID=UPI0040534EEA